MVESRILGGLRVEIVGDIPRGICGSARGRSRQASALAAAAQRVETFPSDSWGGGTVIVLTIPPVDEA